MGMNMNMNMGMQNNQQNLLLGQGNMNQQTPGGFSQQ
jgi:hypothetical protein